MPTCVSSVSIPIGSIYYHRVLNSIAPPPHAGLSMNAWEPIESWSSPVGPKLRLSWFGNLEIRESTGSNYSFPPDPHWFLSRHFPFLALFPSLLTLSLCTLSLSSRSFSPFFHKTLFRFSGSSSNRTSHSFFFYLFIRLFHYAALLAYCCPRYRLRGSSRQCSQRARNDEQGQRMNKLCTLSSPVFLYWLCALF